MSSSRPLLTRLKRHLVDAELLVALLDDRLALDVAEEGDLVVILGGIGCSVRQIRMSGWMPICRSTPTECCVGLVFNSPAAFR